MILAVSIFIVAYIFIASDKIPHALVALGGGFLMLLLHVMPQESALRAIDLSVIFLLIGMMILVEMISETGVFEYVAIKVAQLVKGNPIRLLVLLSIITAVFSAFLDNVTTILLITPITVFIADQLNLDPIPFILSEAMASNIGGTATLIGDPPNILIGSAAKLKFIEFLIHLGPLVVVNLIVFSFTIVFLFGRKMHVAQDLKVRIMEMKPSRAIQDRMKMKKGLFVLALVMIGFLTHGMTGWEPYTIAFAGGIFLAIILKKNPEEIFKKVEWSTLFFFIGLFVLVEGVVHVGAISYLADQVLHATNKDLAVTSVVILWISSIFSSIIDNIPYVATMIPMVKQIIPQIAEHAGLAITAVSYPLWWALSLGACLGGNGSLIGASANVVAASVAARNKRKISFWQFTKYGSLILLQSMILSSFYIYWRYL
jgi:Na+/H+ antiporter NhaD/arsenite permease-like protein